MHLFINNTKLPLNQTPLALTWAVPAVPKRTRADFLRNLKHTCNPRPANIAYPYPKSGLFIARARALSGILR